MAGTERAAAGLGLNMSKRSKPRMKDGTGPVSSERVGAAKMRP